MYPMDFAAAHRPGIRSRSVCAENPTGAKGGACMAVEGYGAHFARGLGKGWKIAPAIEIEPGATAVLADLGGSGVIRHIWMTMRNRVWRDMILRVFWDDEDDPSIEAPCGDFFAAGWCEKFAFSSAAVCVTPACGFNCYWAMPFSSGCRMTVENRHHEKAVLFYQIDYTEEEAASPLRLHVETRRSNPTDFLAPHVILDGVRGFGQYVGTYIAWQSNSCDWWGEGEVKFYLDGDKEYPTICSTGLEDYFGGAWNFDMPGGGYTPYGAPYCGLCQVIRPDGQYVSQQRFGMYRWHLPDPVYFDSDIRVTVQALGVRGGNRFLPLRDDVTSTAFFYQAEPHATRPTLQSADELYVSHKIEW